jgi:hypothetical protein
MTKKEIVEFNKIAEEFDKDITKKVENDPKLDLWVLSYLISKGIYE